MTSHRMRISLALIVCLVCVQPAYAVPTTFFDPGTQLMPSCAPGVCTVRVAPQAFVAVVSTVAAGVLVSDFEHGDVVDGVTLTTGDIILIKNQTVASENGLYTVSATGAPVRVGNSQLIGQQYFVRLGTVGTTKTFTLATTNTYITAAATSSSSITSLNGLTSGVQTFLLGTAGTDLTIVSSGATHTFNIPTASATNRGVLSSADWTTFNGKLATTLTNGSLWIGNGSGIATAVALSGDATVTNAGVLTIGNTAHPRQNGS
ncbi:MAG: hypothetical protein WAX38_00015 [Minisyncoccia bacterium]